MAGVRISGQLRLHHGGQTIEAAAHIGRTTREPNPRTVRHPDHRAAASTSRSILPSTSPRTRTHLATRSISIEPSTCAALTLTAANFTGFLVRDASSWRRHADNKFARTPCRCATSCTEAPATRLSATIRRRCCAVHLPRRRGMTISGPASTDSSGFLIHLLLLADHAPRQRGSLRTENSFQGPRPHAYQRPTLSSFLRRRRRRR